MLEQAERGKGFLSSFSFRCLRSLEDLLASSKGEEGERERRGRERVRDSGGSAPANLRSSVGLFWKKILDKINVANHLENERSHLVTTKNDRHVIFQLAHDQLILLQGANQSASDHRDAFLLPP